MLKIPRTDWYFDQKEMEELLKSALLARGYSNLGPFVFHDQGFTVNAIQEGDLRRIAALIEKELLGL